MAADMGRYPQFFSSRQLGATTMTGATGSEGEILKVLDDCLIKGLIRRTVGSTSLEGDFLVLNFGASHGYLLHQFLTISGADDAVLNGVHRIVKTTETTVSIAKGAIQIFSGVIETFLTPLGWESIFPEAHPLKRAYRSLHPLSEKVILKLDCVLIDTVYAGEPVKAAKVSVHSALTDINSNESLLTISWPEKDGRLFWLQSVDRRFDYNSDAAPSEWVLIGDARMFYFAVAPNTNNNQVERTAPPTLYAFGELPKISPKDKYNTIISLTYYDYVTNLTKSISSHVFDNTGITPWFNVDSSQTSGVYFLQNVDGTKYTSSMERYITSPTTRTTSPVVSGAETAVTSPNPITGGLMFNKVQSFRPLIACFAGVFPYLRAIRGSIPQKFEDYLYGDYLMLPVGATSVNGTVAFDLKEERDLDVSN